MLFISDAQVLLSGTGIHQAWEGQPLPSQESTSDTALIGIAGVLEFQCQDEP